MTPEFLIVGAGFSGAVIARELAERTDAKILVIDERPHVAGNCHTRRDPQTNVMIHEYGPHIFNTDSTRVWQYVNRFGRFESYTNRVKAVTARGVFAMPINLMTINQFFQRVMSPAEARRYVEGLGENRGAEATNFEEQALKLIGRELYENFFLGYTLKQWGVHPTRLPASILKRIPVRFNYDDNYYSTKIQGIPVEGYTAIVARMLDHPNISVELGRPHDRGLDGEFRHTFYTGPIDRYFGYEHGRLGYRTVEFERVDAVGDFQGNAVINYTSADVPYTRVHEHKHFTPWEHHEKTVAFREYSKATGPDDIPYYPTRLAEDRARLERYVEKARETGGVSFLGRLATYRYLDMDDVIDEALSFVDRWLPASVGDPAEQLRFSMNPLAS